MYFFFVPLTIFSYKVSSPFFIDWKLNKSFILNRLFCKFLRSFQKKCVKKRPYLIVFLIQNSYRFHKNLTVFLNNKWAFFKNIFPNSCGFNIIPNIFN